MQQIFNKIIKSEIFYTLLFVSIYLSLFVDIKAGIYFIFGFLYVYTFSRFYNKICNTPVLLVPFFVLPTILGYYFQGIYEVVGFIIGCSVSSFVFLNRNLLTNTTGNSKYTNIALVGQVSFSFFYFYNLVIQDIRGQNKLNGDYVTIGVTAFFLLTTLVVPPLCKFFCKRLDNLSFSNILLITSIIIGAGCLYYPFLEIGSFNVILPVSLIFITAGVIYYFTNTSNHFKFKRTITTLVFSVLPLLTSIFYPWNTSKFLGSMFAAIASITLLSIVIGSTNKEFRFRITGLNTFICNIYLFLMSLFFLSSKGIITKINIAEINYLIAVLLGIVIVFLFEEVREGLKEFAQKLKLLNLLSLVLIGCSVIISYSALDLGGVETLGSMLFGIIGYLFIKNNFNAYKLDSRAKEYVYLENNLLNLLTVFSLSLILTKL